MCHHIVTGRHLNKVLAVLIVIVMIHKPNPTIMIPVVVKRTKIVDSRNLLTVDVINCFIILYVGKITDKVGPIHETSVFYKIKWDYLTGYFIRSTPLTGD